MIDFKSTFKIAVLSLKTNKMRSCLTSLGIIIGVAAVIVMLAIGTGASTKVTKDMESMGSNLLTVRSASANQGGVRQGAGSRPTLTLKDAIAINRLARGVEAVAPVSNQNQQVIYGNQNWSTTVYGTTGRYLGIKAYEILIGRNFTPEDIKNSTKVAIIGSTVSSELFGDVNPVGKTLRIGGVPFRVIAVLKTKGSTGPFDNDDLIFIPITTAQKKVFGVYFPGTVNMIVVKSQTPELMEYTEEDINEILTKRHNIGINQEKDFEIRNSAEFQERLKSTVKTFSILLGSIASVSLLVGGIGIMNIMLVSVTERTREIGIRMAIGARSSDIRKQFLIEALLLAIIGGLIGVVAGVLTSFLVTKFSDLTAEITPFSIILSLSFSAIVGVVFGFYPAYKASLLNPIDALRYE
ncbi:TPA: ABC transporter permease [Candidatus Galligastranaerophilus intestinigallinarum]|nr:ABC transporter permease [Candidatus Galligastranaerophilus intestinigallinarum]